MDMTRKFDHLNQTPNKINKYTFYDIYPIKLSISLVTQI